jgi:uridine kinase
VDVLNRNAPICRARLPAYGDKRDRRGSRSIARVEQRFRNRYLPSQQHYFDTVRPTDLADIVVHNDEPERPAWEVRPH